MNTRVSDTTYQNLILEKTRIVLAQRFNRDFLENVHTDAVMDHAANVLVVRLEKYLASNTIHREVFRTRTFPAHWWDAVKDRFFQRGSRSDFPFDTKQSKRKSALFTFAPTSRYRTVAVAST